MLRVKKIILLIVINSSVYTDGELPEYVSPTFDNVLSIISSEMGALSLVDIL